MKSHRRIYVKVNTQMDDFPVGLSYTYDMRHPPGVDLLAERMASEAAKVGHRWVVGPEGSGRSTLAHILAMKVPNAAFLDLPTLDQMDFSAALAILAAEAMKYCGSIADEAGRPSQDLRSAVVQADRLWIVRLTGRLAPSLAADADTEHARRRAVDALSLLAQAPRVVWIADPGVQPSEVGVTRPERDWLPSFAIELLPERYPGFEKKVRILCDLVGKELHSPVEWRLSLGAIILGARPEQVVALVRGSSSNALGSLAKLLADRLLRKRKLALATRKLLLLRRPLPASELLAVVTPPSGMEKLLVSCVGYGNPVRVNPVVARVLSSHLDALAPSEAETSHAAFAKAYAQIDGAPDPLRLEPAAGLHWIEKLHHLAQAGQQGVEEWTRQSKPCPELFWERARYYSVVVQDYATAASIYRDCIAAFPSDGYGHQYLAFNAKKAGHDRKVVAEHFRLAAELDQTNPWWNARRISDLIETKNWIVAKQSLFNALNAIDPDGSRTATDPWFVAHFHYWVAKAWLNARVWYEARSVLAGIPRSVLEEASRIRRPDVSELERDIARMASRERKSFEGWLEKRKGEDAWMRLSVLWHAIESNIEGLPVPIAAETEEGEALTWSQPAVFVEIGLTPHGFRWLARDRLSAEYDRGVLRRSQPDEKLQRWLLRARHV